MNDRINQALTKLFDRHRIVFWYDTKQELRADYEALAISGIEKIELKNNEFATKYRILREQPDQKYLIYHEGSQPDDLDNWLLDVQLAHGEFRTDRVALWLSELDLGLEFADVVEAHAEFYQAVKRQESLKRLIAPDDTPRKIRMKMLAVCAGSEPRLDAIAENLLAELASDRDDKIRLISRCSLDGFLWEQMQKTYGYQSSEKGIEDFAIQLFKHCYFQNFPSTSTQKLLSSDALVFLKRWKDSRQFAESFETLSLDCGESLSIEHDISNRDFRDLIDLDYFRLIDKKVISDLVHGISSRTIATADVSIWVRQRRQCHWYAEFEHLYEAIDYAAQFIQTLEEANLAMDSMVDGIEKYTCSWFRIDRLYRKFIYHVQCAGEVSLMGGLNTQIENLYSNKYLLKLSDRWQTLVDAASKWDVASIPTQKNFFKLWVRPFLDKDNKVCVIISDAMRYEVGDEFLSLIRQEDRYEATIEPALSMLPSFTQLGMAALLPNTTLKFSDNDTGEVLVDDLPSRGTINRDKILKQAVNNRATAIKSENFMNMNRDESRELFKANDVIYVYHNRIDHTGDKLQSEGQAFEAAEQALEDLLKLVKKLAAANANNILLTADHGFIYQNQAIAESDYLSQDVTGQTILYRDRRFVLGKGLNPSSSVKFFTAAALGLDGDMEVCIPKSINRLRLKGSGSRFVHGGATLQEVVIPIIKINKKRQSDVSVVEIDILRGSSSTITSGQLAVLLYQVEPITDKVQSRTLRAGIYTLAGDLISDSHDLTFDFTSDNPRERELQVRFLMTRKADSANNQEVILRLEEKLTGTSHYKEYKSVRYQMRRSFTSDFDF